MYSIASSASGGFSILILVCRERRLHEKDAFVNRAWGASRRMRAEAFGFMTPARALIFANGILPDLEKARGLLEGNETIICADGGTRHALASG